MNDEALVRIEAKLDALNARLDALEGPVRGGLATAGDLFDDLVDRVPGGAAEVDQRLRRLTALGLRVTEVDTLERLAAAVDLLESLEGVIATAGDTFDDLADRARARGVELEAIVGALVGGDALRRDNVALIVRALGEVGNAAETSTAPVGLLGLLRALREPEIQRTLGFLLQYARRLGAALDDPALARAALAPAPEGTTP